MWFHTDVRSQLLCCSTRSRKLYQSAMLRLPLSGNITLRCQKSRQRDGSPLLRLGRQTGCAQIHFSSSVHVSLH